MAITDTQPILSNPSQDPRSKLFLGFWQRSLPQRHTQPAMDRLDEPHFKRRREILRKYPQIKSLYGIEWRTKWIALSGVVVQWLFAYLFGNVWTDTWLGLLLAAYVVGGTLTGVFGVVLHEATHNLCAESVWANRLIGLMTNCGVVVPIFSSFRRYHLEHHTYQGVQGYDPDLPMDWEIRLIKGNTLMKLLWIMIYPVMYVVRGAAMGREPSYWEKINWVWTIASNTLLWMLCGWRGLIYLLASLWLGYSLHPAAVHFIQEHYTWQDGQETYSYYGKGNTIMLNIGYHNEHHDFAQIPWSKLPDLKAMAPEYYDTLHAHTSWVACMYEFLTSGDFGPQSRVERTVVDHRQARRMRISSDKTH